MSKRYLLDTQTLILWRIDSPSLGKKAIRALKDESTQLVLSVASIWEMCIKRSLGKLDLGMPTQEFVQTAVAAGVSLLEMRPDHLYRVESLPFHHRDPFDRLLAAQAAVEGMPILGKDPIFQRYGVSVVW